eukprot:evm.model.scf_42.11 EVM.evm.TU.scf_42.11   scf_42:74561-81267(-)
MAEKTRCLVTGGSGFVGQHLVQLLLKSGKYDIVVFDIREPPSQIEGAKFVKGDLTSADEVNNVCKGIQIVFHVATASPTGANALNKELMHAVNVMGTTNIIEACVNRKVERLVLTSSASVVFEGQDLVNVDESVEYARHPMDYYTSTKIEAEKLVLAANGREGTLATCALRPSAIFGEGDNIFVPTLVERAKKGKMKYMVGKGENKMDFTYVGNVAQAHVQAAEHLTLKSPLAGKAYFVTNQDPQPFWGFMGDICEGLGYDRPRVKLPYLLILFIMMIFEYLILPLLSLFMKVQTDMTVNRIKLSTCNRMFNCKRAKEDFGYVPGVSMDEALKRTLASFQHLRAA